MPGIGEDAFAPDWGAIEQGNMRVVADALQLIYALVFQDKANRSGALLVNLNASQLTTGIVPDARFPASLPAINGSNLTGFTAGQIPGLDASKIVSGTMATARLGSGTADATTVLRGDSTWVLMTTIKSIQQVDVNAAPAGAGNVDVAITITSVAKSAAFFIGLLACPGGVISSAKIISTGTFRFVFSAAGAVSGTVTVIEYL